MGWIDKILGIAKVIADRLGERMYEWGRFAAEEPRAAAELLYLTAGDLEARASARRRQDGWIARRLYARARALRAHARDLRRRAAGQPCLANPLRRPGT
jgi:hypothetical protein